MEKELITGQKELSIEKQIEDILTCLPEHCEAIYQQLYQHIPSELLLLEKTDVSDKEINHFTELHNQEYTQKAQEIVKEDFDCLVIRSCMYGGKSTLSFKILDSLKEKRLRTRILIADVMGECFVTGRSYIDGKKKRKAWKFGESNTDKMIKYLVNSDIDAILLDEFSFLDPEIVAKLKETCIEANKKLILTGLDRNYLGDELPAFRNGSKILQTPCKQITCQAFEPGRSNGRLPQEIYLKPDAERTIRYAKINYIDRYGNKKEAWIYDAGILPLVVSKVHEHIVYYKAATKGKTVKDICSENGLHRLQQTLLNPVPELVSAQKDFLEEIDSAVLEPRNHYSNY